MGERPKVGVGVIIRKEGKVLLGKRLNSHGDKTWCFPGGHLEFGESVEDCAIRETIEETGLKIKNIKPVTFTNDIFRDEDKHYITLFAVADLEFGNPKVLEPEKCEEWKWFKWDELPSPLFLPVSNLKKMGFNPFAAAGI